MTTQAKSGNLFCSKAVGSGLLLIPEGKKPPVNSLSDLTRSSLFTLFAVAGHLFTVLSCPATTCLSMKKVSHLELEREIFNFCL